MFCPKYNHWLSLTEYNRVKNKKYYNFETVNPRVIMRKVTYLEPCLTVAETDTRCPIIYKVEYFLNPKLNKKIFHDDVLN